MSVPAQRTTEPVPAGERGTLSIARSVVRVIAERAADDVDGTAEVERRIAGLGFGRHGASVKVSGSGGDVVLAVDVALRYPSPVRSVVDDVRARVTADVERMTSYRVRGLDITVSALRGESQVRVR
ncbi:Asp23/Gls24 family envelope stress response protein [Saccharomonospora sp. NPDC006951]